MSVSEVPSLDMANAIRALSMDAVQAANSGHPGLPMGMADVATVLFSKFLKFDPTDPDWPDRDRFVLSAGHGSMLLYSLLHLTGYADMTIDEIRNFRQWGSKTAGHPEYGVAGGIETTTGPLGQGLANGVGMAIAERILAARFGADLVDHYTYVLAGDGCLMEGISHEAISLAGHLKLSKLILLFDDNGITIDGPTDISVSDNQAERSKASGWHVLATDGHDMAAVAAVIEEARISDRPTMIACKTIIGYGAPNKQGTSAVHGAALGEEEVAATREALGWPHPAFEIPNSIIDAWRAVGARGQSDREAWQARLAKSDDKPEFERVVSGALPAGFQEAMNKQKRKLAADQPAVATRAASRMALEVINQVLPETIGGSADLTGSNLTQTAETEPVSAGDFSGRYIYYGVREHAMAAAMNGMALHGGIIPYGGTFLVFTDYCRPSIRLAALMEQRVIYVMTHDSIGLGEDGPTHQAVEHIPSLRAMPNLNVFRPADAVETLECWALAITSAKTPSVIALSRQNVDPVRTEHVDENRSARGGYELLAAEGAAQITLMASGTEVGIAVAARDLLQSKGIATRVVSMPCLELFDAQDESYRNEVLGPGTKRIAIEAAAAQGWDKYIGVDGAFIGMHSFGASAPLKVLYEKFGITAEAVTEKAEELL